VRAPEDLKPGKYVIEAAFNAGPFGGEIKATKSAVVE
jgi:hypothetical protein